MAEQLKKVSHKVCVTSATDTFSSLSSIFVFYSGARGTSRARPPDKLQPLRKSSAATSRESSALLWGEKSGRERKDDGERQEPHLSATVTKKASNRKTFAKFRKKLLTDDI